MNSPFVGLSFSKYSLKVFSSDILVLLYDKGMTASKYYSGTLAASILLLSLLRDFGMR